jgi:hypothetical protein
VQQFLNLNQGKYCKGSTNLSAVPIGRIITDIGPVIGACSGIGVRPEIGARPGIGVSPGIRVRSEATDLQ